MYSMYVHMYSDRAASSYLMSHLCSLTRSNDVKIYRLVVAG